MLRRLTAWVLFSPARLALAAFCGLAVMALLVVMAHQPTGAPAEARPTHDVTPSAAAPRPRASSPSIGAESKNGTQVATARRVAKRFLALYLQPATQVPARAPRALARLCTPSLWTGLRMADPAALPTDPLMHLRTVGSGAYASEFIARIPGERALVVDVVAWSHGWRVSDVHPEDGT